MSKTGLTLRALNIAPVKSLGLCHPNSVHVGESGIIEDRRFHVVDAMGRLMTQRQIARMVQVKAEYRLDPEQLALTFPDGSEVEGEAESGEPVTTFIFGRMVKGRVVTGGFGEALSEFCGADLRLVKSDEPGQCQDAYPISVLSQGSLDKLQGEPGISKALDNRRFRPNFFIGNSTPHEEDSWVGREVRVGDEVQINVVARDPRCAITTHDPDSGSRDMNTLRAILGYRPDRQAAYFGVYAIVSVPGSASVGDGVEMVG
jgi:uncharacterized protein YcbX